MSAISSEFGATERRSGPEPPEETLSRQAKAYLFTIAAIAIASAKSDKPSAKAAATAAAPASAAMLAAAQNAASPALANRTIEAAVATNPMPPPTSNGSPSIGRIVHSRGHGNGAAASLEA